MELGVHIQCGCSREQLVVFFFFFLFRVGGTNILCILPETVQKGGGGRNIQTCPAPPNITHTDL